MDTTPFVSSIDGDTVVVACAGREFRRRVAGLGGRRELWSNRMRFPCRDEFALAGLLSRLRDAGAAFAGAVAGWPPAAVFQELRDKGLVHGPFVEIVWHAR